MKPLRTLIVDDEMLARKRLREMLEERNDIEVLAECFDGKDAKLSIEKLGPDLVFLDVQMPELDGFGVLQELELSSPPSIVFVSAFSEYAIRAFEVNARDYLLKPFNAVRLNAAVDRVRAIIDTNKTSGNDSTVTRKSSTGELNQRQLGDRIALKYGDRVHLVPMRQIVWIKAARNYVQVHANGRQYLLRESMSRLASRLDPSNFVRIHRSVIINIECVESLERTFHGDYRVFLNDGSALPLSRNYKSAMQARFGDQI